MSGSHFVVYFNALSSCLKFLSLFLLLFQVDVLFLFNDNDMLCLIMLLIRLLLLILFNDVIIDASY